jgi:hypothetical protein
MEDSDQPSRGVHEHQADPPRDGKDGSRNGTGGESPQEEIPRAGSELGPLRHRRVMVDRAAIARRDESA